VPIWKPRTNQVYERQCSKCRWKSTTTPTNIRKSSPNCRNIYRDDHQNHTGKRTKRIHKNHESDQQNNANNRTNTDQHTTELVPHVNDTQTLFQTIEAKDWSIHSNRLCTTVSRDVSPRIQHHHFLRSLFDSLSPIISCCADEVLVCLRSSG